MNLAAEAARDGDSVVAAGGWRIASADRRRHAGDGGTLTARPAARGHRDRRRRASPAEVVAVEPFGSEVIVDVRVGRQALKVRAAPAVRPAPGSTIALRADPAAVRLFDARAGAALS